MLVFLDQLARIVLLAVFPFIGHCNLRGFQFRCHLYPELAQQGDALPVTEKGAFLAVQVCAPACRALQIVMHGRGTGIGAVHFALERLELGQGDVTGAATGTGRIAAIKGSKRFAALAGQIGFENIGGGVQVALGGSTDQLAVLGEGHITFNDTGTHACGGPIGFLGVLGELERGTTVADG